MTAQTHKYLPSEPIDEMLDVERFSDLSDVNEVSDTEVRIILGLLLKNLNLIPARKTYMRKGIETVSYHLVPTSE